ncbi:glutamine amidotransferase class-II family protein [Asticcacaulis biprosthecium C19]|uniref:Glutamine amidotransferase class-II family protein n=1 Tax=Asticcacaulis biprosthecium C19 TaxID=715226 RepID=F4QHN1_9CAUL|nr:class II glutamine amidotransferase [Asticcacaulis biprosthecium]EGF92768.1 glutamine amidotransferase class-II family protein [Asticcacaulis biprosthecium C19]
MSAISSDILAFSFDGLSSPSIDLKFRKGPQKGEHTLGWGLTWYPGDNKGAVVAKDPSARDTKSLRGAMHDWDSFRSTVFFCKVRGAATGYTHLETQPFSRAFAGQDWVFMHNGDLDKTALNKLHFNKSIFLEPMGRTDSEAAFCFLLGKVQDYGARTLAEVDHQVLLSWFLQLDDLGSADMILSDGTTVAAFFGSQSVETQLYYSRIKPPHSEAGYHSDSATFALNNPRDTFRTALVFSSTPFHRGDWKPMQKGQLIIARRGAIVWTNKKDEKQTTLPQVSHEQDGHLQGVTVPAEKPRHAPGRGFASQQAQAQQLSIVQSLQQMKAVQHNVLSPRAITHAPDGSPLTYRLYDVTHSTEYAYEHEVEHSTHSFRLMPLEDLVQEVMTCTLSLSSEGEDVRFEDVFGNQTLHYSIIKPYKKLTVSCRSLVKVYGQAPDDYSVGQRQAFIPLTMMPWQQVMMEPYLRPPELPETQIRELLVYAMSFAERNGQHLMDTLNDINQTIYRDFRYVPGSTSLRSTPFDVYASREGVCQDFANLFICLARLLGVAARYRVGYIFTGANYENKIQSDASHAWVEIYIPYLGWRGFDPTNGCRVTQDHIRVAAGRNYLDATPTSGTIYRGGGKETLRVQVTMNEVFN